MSKSYRITILGQVLSVKHDSGDEYVAEVVQYVTNKIYDTQKGAAGAGALSVAIVAALNIADDYFKHRSVNDVIMNRLEDKSESLIRILNNIE